MYHGKIRIKWGGGWSKDIHGWLSATEWVSGHCNK